MFSATRKNISTFRNVNNFLQVLSLNDLKQIIQLSGKIKQIKYIVLTFSINIDVQTLHVNMFSFTFQQVYTCHYYGKPAFVGRFL